MAQREQPEPMAAKKKAAGKKTKKPAAVKKPSFSEATFQAIVSDIADGDSMRKATATHGVPRKAFFAAVNANAEWGNQYARALEMGCEALADDILTIADDGSQDLETRYNSDGEPYTVVDAEVMGRSRLRVDARKWLLSKRMPKKYGDKVTQELTGVDGAPIQVQQMPDWKDVQAALSKV